MSEQMLLAEDEVVESLAFLISSARCQLDDPPDYGSMRLLDAAERLSAFVQDRASPQTKKLLALILEESPKIQSVIADREQYKSMLDELCRDMAQHLVEQSIPAAGR